MKKHKNLFFAEEYEDITLKDWLYFALVVMAIFLEGFVG